MPSRVPEVKWTTHDVNLAGFRTETRLDSLRLGNEAQWCTSHFSEADVEPELSVGRFHGDRGTMLGTRTDET